MAFGALGNLSSVSLPAPSPTSGSSASAAPKNTTVNSPSASTPSTNNDNQATVKDAILPNSTGIEKSSPDSNINTAMSLQSALLEQILSSTNNLVSVNKDILKYARTNA